jgi:excisionase family DNA binding protein
MERLLLKPTEAAEVIGLGRSKTYQLISSGAIPSVRIGKSVRVPVAALRTWIEKQIQEQQRLQEGSA